MSTYNEWRGDAPAVAQILELEPPKNDGEVEFYIGGRPLGFNQKWSLVTPAGLDAIIKLWNDSKQGEFREVIASKAGANLKLTAKEAGRPFAVTTTVGGEELSNEVQIVTLSNATGGNFTLSFLTETTAAIAYNATAAALQSALVALTAIASGDVLVSKVGSVWTVRFAGAYVGTDVPPLRVNFSGLTGGTCAVTVTTIEQGILPVNCQQLVNLHSTITGGTATLSWNGGTTSALAWNASAATVQTAVDTAWGAGAVTVTGSTLKAGLTFTFIGNYAGQDVELITGNGLSLTGGLTLLTVSTTTAGVTGTNASHNWKLNADPSVADSSGVTGYWFQIRVYVQPGGTNQQGAYYETRWISYTETAAQIQVAVENMRYPGYSTNQDPLPCMGSGNVSVTGALSGSWVGGAAGLTLAFLGRNHSVPIHVMFYAASTYTTNISAQPHRNARGISATKTVISPGVVGTNEVQRITQSANSGVGGFRIVYDGIASEQVEYCAGSTQQDADDWAAKLRAALARHPSIGTTGRVAALYPGSVQIQPGPTPGITPGFFVNVSVAVTAGSAPYAQLTFMGAGLQSTNVDQITVIEAATVVYVTRTVTGYAGQAAVQTIDMSGAPWGGTWTLTYSGQTTSALIPQVPAGDVQLALEALSNLVPGNLVVAGSYPNWTATFAAILGDVDTMIGNAASLRNGSVTIDTLTAGGQSVVQLLKERSRGPWHGDDPKNWTAGFVSYQHIPWLRTGVTGPRWGITWRTAFTLDTLDPTLIKIPGGYSSGGDFNDGQAVKVRSSGTLPSGLAANTLYYVRDWSGVGFRLASSLDGTPISFSGGSGTHEIYIQLDGLKTFATWTGGDAGIGNYLTDKPAGFREYRPQYLRAGWTTGSKITLSEGVGGGSGLVRIDTADFRVVIEILGSGGARETGLPPVLWIGQNVDNVVNNYGASLGIGLLRDEVVALKDYIQRSGSVEIGPGVTFTANGTIDVTGGKVLSQATIAGPAWIRG
jgi:hypothetical protein